MVDRGWSGSIGGGLPPRSRSIVCDAAYAAAALSPAAGPCARRPPAVRGNRAGRSACLAARRPRAARRNATAMLASATSDGRNWRSSVADASREWPASNWANAASVASSARPSRPSADAFSRPNSSASTSAGKCFVLRWGIARSARVGTPSSTGDHRPVEPNLGRSLDALAAIGSYSCRRRCSMCAPRLREEQQ